jgi:hypothetical protein
MNEDYKFDSLIIPEKGHKKFEDKGLTQIIPTVMKRYIKPINNNFKKNKNNEKYFTNNNFNLNKLRQ